MRLDDFDYHLPKDMIAQEGVEPRDAARLMVLGEDGSIDHLHMRDLPQVLGKGDLLVANESRVIAARVRARKPTGGRAELVFLEPLGDGRWDCLVGGGRLSEGSILLVGEGEDGSRVLLMEPRGPGRYAVSVEGGPSPEELMGRWGEMPTPPYIRTHLEDQDRYQTTYARVDGSVAAPTAGLHFNDTLLRALESAGVAMVKLVLHVGYGTFQPVRADRVEDHVMESERLEVSEGVAASINEALDTGRRVIAVGTTTVRCLESVTDGDGRVLPLARSTDLFIYPGYRFRFPYSGLMTNFHLPRSTLLMLVSAYRGREEMLAAYRGAVAREYRFYSLGDGMLIMGGPV
ncbi:MAG: tRNA preQ1(34) S-adenosylmethionine ribosyltransferase-isomerase QueA [Thermoplasmata archaeon]|nr:MAG: tRNA preQ1(34) S-adenosylmethionine ribosyltransferase-isomerase QueA [Thermoplasmata archaeon]